MNDYILALKDEFRHNTNPDIALGQKAYMKHNFSFFGMKSKTRREAQKHFLSKEYLPAKTDLNDIIIELWELPERDFQLFGQELIEKFIKQFEIKDIDMLEYIITNKSWWDSVDFIATHLVGKYFKIYPEQIQPITTKWMLSGNIWLQRTCLLFQLKYKKDLDIDLLESFIHPLIGSKEFFINKAIGWVLREYGKTNPEWVITFTERTELANLSRKEALRIINS